MSGSDSDDDTGVPTLSPELLAALRPEALAALQEVLNKRVLEATGEGTGDDDSAAGITENWNLSQFWYTKETSHALATEILAAVESTGRRGPIACLSCPSTYMALKPLAAAAKRDIILFEYDKRFGRSAERFVFYDCNKPLEFPRELVGVCAGVVVDPPYLNADCLKSFSSTVLALSASADVPVMLCTGSVMCTLARKLLAVRPTNFEIKHEGSRLSNPFTCYVSYADASRLGGWNEELERASTAEGGANGK